MFMLLCFYIKLHIEKLTQSFLNIFYWIRHKDAIIFLNLYLFMIFTTQTPFFPLALCYSSYILLLRVWNKSKRLIYYGIIQSCTRSMYVDCIVWFVRLKWLWVCVSVCSWFLLQYYISVHLFIIAYLVFNIYTFNNFDQFYFNSIQL